MSCRGRRTYQHTSLLFISVPLLFIAVHCCSCEIPALLPYSFARIRGFGHSAGFFLICSPLLRPTPGFGHSADFFLICSPCFFANFSDFRYSRGFQKNCSPRPVSVWAQRQHFTRIDPISSCIHGEHLNKTGRLCPIRIHRIRIHGEQFCQIGSCAQTQEKPWGTILKNQLLCLNRQMPVFPVL